ncbi:hypothetical protein B0T19DRAFT_224777 [Cercophora scortea]|uniref:Uncharacterized protein n=1 Tax=Cercophora scortea TaxID=314031 RepID=A0AAE0IH37_9PEZI|nr:hypothetical protein B0T19DRAFT_224777 [Cercophora scortea]
MVIRSRNDLDQAFAACGGQVEKVPSLIFVIPSAHLFPAKCRAHHFVTCVKIRAFLHHNAHYTSLQDASLELSVRPRISIPSHRVLSASQPLSRPLCSDGIAQLNRRRAANLARPPPNITYLRYYVHYPYNTWYNNTYTGSRRVTDSAQHVSRPSEIAGQETRRSEVPESLASNQERQPMSTVLPVTAHPHTHTHTHPDPSQLVSPPTHFRPTGYPPPTRPPGRLSTRAALCCCSLQALPRLAPSRGYRVSLAARYYLCCPGNWVLGTGCRMDTETWVG